MNMDDKEWEYRALLERVTREAERQAELDMQNRAQPPEPEEFRNGPSNILNRLDVHARLGSRVAPLEERILHSFVFLKKIHIWVAHLQSWAGCIVCIHVTPNMCMSIPTEYNALFSGELSIYWPRTLEILFSGS